MTSPPSLDGRKFRALADDHAGDVDGETVFEYHERDGLIWASYTGGAVALGYLVGVRDQDRLEFRYSHVTVEGITASGHCESTIEVLVDGRLRCHEQWEWDSRPGSGTSTIEEIASPGHAAAPHWPVSVKGVVLTDGAVLLVHNERDEWELPGGRLEADETPDGCVVREIREETGLVVEAGPLIDTWVYAVRPDRAVLIVAYACALAGEAEIIPSAEHDDARWVPLAELDHYAMPQGYRDSIRRHV